MEQTRRSTTNKADAEQKPPPRATGSACISSSSFPVRDYHAEADKALDAMFPSDRNWRFPAKMKPREMAVAWKNTYRDAINKARDVGIDDDELWIEPDGLILSAFRDDFQAGKFTTSGWKRLKHFLDLEEPPDENEDPDEECQSAHPESTFDDDQDSDRVVHEVESSPQETNQEPQPPDASLPGKARRFAQTSEATSEGPARVDQLKERNVEGGGASGLRDETDDSTFRLTSPNAWPDSMPVKHMTESLLTSARKRKSTDVDDWSTVPKVARSTKRQTPTDPDRDAPASKETSTFIMKQVPRRRSLSLPRQAISPPNTGASRPGHSKDLVDLDDRTDQGLQVPITQSNLNRCDAQLAQQFELLRRLLREDIERTEKMCRQDLVAVRQLDREIEERAAAAELRRDMEAYDELVEKHKQGLRQKYHDRLADIAERFREGDDDSLADAGAI